MQPFSADATIFKKRFAPEKMQKLPSKVPHKWPKCLLKYCQPAQNQPKSNFLFYKNVSFYIMTLK